MFDSCPFVRISVATLQLHIEDIPNFTIDESTRELPNIKGTGLVYDAFIKYNTDEAFKVLAKNYVTLKERYTMSKRDNLFTPIEYDLFNNYENLNKQDIMVDIFTKAA